MSCAHGRTRAFISGYYYFFILIERGGGGGFNPDVAIPFGFLSRRAVSDTRLHSFFSLTVSMSAWHC